MSTIVTSIVIIHPRSILTGPSLKGGSTLRRNLIGGSVTVKTVSTIIARMPRGLKSGFITIIHSSAKRPHSRTRNTRSKERVTMTSTVVIGTF